MSIGLVRVTVTLLLVHLTKSQQDVDCFHNRSHKPGVCVGLKYCESAIRELKQEKRILPQTCRFEGGYPLVCCPVEASSKPSKAEEVCQQYEKDYADLIQDGARWSIVGGEDASPGEFPHMAALGYQDGRDIKWFCGGTLISDRFILTAAHCLKHTELGQVRYVKLGDVKLEDSPTSKMYNVFKVYQHPEFHPPKTYNDIALLELSEPVDISPYIRPACLMTNSTPEALQRFKPQATGWGLTNYFGSPSEVLQKVELEKFDDCNKKYQITRRIPEGILDELHICYGSRTEEKDACSGDSGGPLQYFDYSVYSYRVIGVTSFGNGCGTPGLPGVYTRVSRYVPWIESIVWP